MYTFKGPKTTLMSPYIYLSYLLLKKYFYKRCSIVPKNVKMFTDIYILFILLKRIFLLRYTIYISLAYASINSHMPCLRDFINWMLFIFFYGILYILHIAVLNVGHRLHIIIEGH